MPLARICVRNPIRGLQIGYRVSFVVCGTQPRPNPSPRRRCRSNYPHSPPSGFRAGLWRLDRLLWLLLGCHGLRCLHGLRRTRGLRRRHGLQGTHEVRRSHGLHRVRGLLRFHVFCGDCLECGGPMGFPAAVGRGGSMECGDPMGSGDPADPRSASRKRPVELALERSLPTARVCCCRCSRKLAVADRSWYKFRRLPQFGTHAHRESDANIEQISRLDSGRRPLSAVTQRWAELVALGGSGPSSEAGAPSKPIKVARGQLVCATSSLLGGLVAWEGFGWSLVMLSISRPLWGSSFLGRAPRS